MNGNSEKTIFDDMAELEKTIADDVSGDRARAMVKYFDGVVKSSESMLQQQLQPNERQMTIQLIDGFRASQRIIQHVWETVHAASLAV